MTFKVDPKLKDFATPRQAQYIDAVNKHGSHRKAAEHLEVAHSAVDVAMVAVRRKAALQNYSPEHDMTEIVPAPYNLKGQSSLYKVHPDGSKEVKLQWVKTTLDQERRGQMLVEAFADLVNDVKRLKPTAVFKKSTVTDLCNVYTLTDCHVGMLAWHKEGGADWDGKIAENTIVGAFQQMVADAPAAETGIIAQLGDFMHYDSLVPVTPTGGNILDADSRYSKMVQIAIRTLRTVVSMALEKHKKVVLLIAEGNHDMASSVVLRQLFKALYENEPRIEVIDNELPFYAYEFGKVGLFWHHSHMVKMESLPLVFATEFAEIWGRTKKRFGHTGDKHHKSSKEYSGIIMEQHPTLAARDAYSSRHGWNAQRSACVITYHREFGERRRDVVPTEMLQAA